MDDFQHDNRLYVENLLQDRRSTTCLIAAAYCESQHVDYIRYTQLRSMLSRFLRRTVKGLDISSEGFKKLVADCESGGFFRVTREPGKTCIYPNFPAIQQLDNEMRMQSSTADSDRIRLTIERVKHRHLPVETVPIFDRLSAVVTKAKTGEVKAINPSIPKVASESL